MRRRTIQAAFSKKFSSFALFCREEDGNDIEEVLLTTGKADEDGRYR
jgi:hypothetical protein